MKTAQNTGHLACGLPITGNPPGEHTQTAIPEKPDFLSNLTLPDVETVVDSILERRLAPTSSADRRLHDLVWDARREGKEPWQIKAVIKLLAKRQEERTSRELIDACYGRDGRASAEVISRFRTVELTDTSLLLWLRGFTATEQFADHQDLLCDAVLTNNRQLVQRILFDRSPETEGLRTFASIEKAAEIAHRERKSDIQTLLFMGRLGDSPATQNQSRNRAPTQPFTYPPLSTDAARSSTETGLGQNPALIQPFSLPSESVDLEESPSDESMHNAHGRRTFTGTVRQIRHVVRALCSELVGHFSNFL